MNPSTHRAWRSAIVACLAAIALCAAAGALKPWRTPVSAVASIHVLRLDRVDPAKPGILFRSTRSDDTFKRVAFLPLDALDGPWYMTDLTCERVHFRGRRGVCVTDSAIPMLPHTAMIFDDQFQIGRSTRLTGVPSRTKMSPDGAVVAVTVFVLGHSYAAGGFSTQTTLLDTQSAKMITDLETFAVFRDGVLFKGADFNFWGVTFASDGNRFYATLRSGGTNYLIEGAVDRRTARVIATGVECPSLSPDGRRLAVKKRANRPDVQWHIALLDLATMRETVLDAEQRSVDDQVEWLDDNHVLYNQTGPEGNNIWMLRIDLPEPPRIVVREGWSPAVIR